MVNPLRPDVPPDRDLQLEALDCVLTGDMTGLHLVLAELTPDQLNQLADAADTLTSEIDQSPASHRLILVPDDEGEDEDDE